MDDKDYREIIDKLRDGLELLRLSGIHHIPKAEKAEPPCLPCIDKWVIAEGAPPDREVCPAHGALKGVALGLWAKGKAAYLYGGLFAGEDRFCGEQAGQIERIIDWVSKEAGTSYASIELYRCYAFRCSGFSIEEAAKELAPYILKRLEGVSVVSAFGDAASFALLGSSVDGLRGKLHKARNFLVAPTHGAEKLLKNQTLKKETMEDLKLVIKELKAGN